MILTYDSMGHPAKLEVPTTHTPGNKHARIARKFSERISRPQTPFLRGWLRRNLLRWRRTIRRVPPFQRDSRDQL